MLRNRRGRPDVQDFRHSKVRRRNNPPAGIAPTYEVQERQATHYAYDSHLDPQLVWSGKAEHPSFEVDLVSLHIHERISTRAILDAVRRLEPLQLNLFGEIDAIAAKYQPQIDQALTELNQLRDGMSSAKCRIRCGRRKPARPIDGIGIGNVGGGIGDHLSANAHPAVCRSCRGRPRVCPRGPVSDRGGDYLTAMLNLLKRQGSVLFPGGKKMELGKLGNLRPLNVGQASTSGLPSR